MYDHTSTIMFDKNKTLALCESLSKAGHTAVISLCECVVGRISLEAPLDITFQKLRKVCV